jgi:hypothetical protein
MKTTSSFEPGSFPLRIHTGGTVLYIHCRPGRLTNLAEVEAQVEQVVNKWWRLKKIHQSAKRDG